MRRCPGSRGFPETRGLIHENDIKMLAFPDRLESVEVFRRWWTDVAEYCERFPTFPNCSFLFKKLRGYTEAVEIDKDVARLFEELDDDLPSDQTMHFGHVYCGGRVVQRGEVCVEGSMR